jgi:N-hydroxyarylamine O-acetyltransferase
VPNYRFDNTPRRIEEYAAMAHYHQTSPESPFPNKRLITQSHPGGKRVTLTDQALKITEGGQKQVTPLNREQTFEKMLLQHFGLSWPPTPG